MARTINSPAPMPMCKPLLAIAKGSKKVVAVETFEFHAPSAGYIAMSAAGCAEEPKPWHN